MRKIENADGGFEPFTPLGTEDDSGKLFGVGRFGAPWPLAIEFQELKISFDVPIIDTRQSEQCARSGTLMPKHIGKLDSNPAQSEDINSKSGTEVLYVTIEPVCRDDCCRKRSGASIAGIHGRHAGSGSRGSHQLGKTPIWPLPTRTNFFYFPNNI